MIIGEEELKSILASVDHEWFTSLIWWEQRRYVVWLTNNTSPSFDLLVIQIHLFARLFDDITIGWRMSPQWPVFIDVGTCTDDLDLAKTLGVSYHQKCIWDNQEKVEIRLE